MLTSTIYRIYNVINGKSYIGQTTQITQRISAHFGSLASGTHSNRTFVAEYRKYGRDAFEVAILETNISTENANEREVFWIEQFNALKTGYNVQPGGKNHHVWQKTSEYLALRDEIKALSHRLYENRQQMYVIEMEYEEIHSKIKELEKQKRRLGENQR